MIASILLAATFAADHTERVGRFTHRGIVEPSGLVASRRFPGIFWTHNDSGNPPALFAVRRDGSLVREYKVAAANVDWEDISTDDAGHLYIGDIGDNLHVLPVHAILRLDEPDPRRAFGESRWSRPLPPPAGTPTASGTTPRDSSWTATERSWSRRTSTAARPSYSRYRSMPPPRS